jgi:hypothetical protein
LLNAVLPAWRSESLKASVALLIAAGSYLFSVLADPRSTDGKGYDEYSRTYSEISTDGALLRFPFIRFPCVRIVQHYYPHFTGHFSHCMKSGPQINYIADNNLSVSQSVIQSLVP